MKVSDTLCRLLHKPNNQIFTCDSCCPHPETTAPKKNGIKLIYHTPVKSGSYQDEWKCNKDPHKIGDRHGDIHSQDHAYFEGTISFSKHPGWLT